METPCLEWTAGRDRDGYGQAWQNGKGIRAHRLAWELERGKIPAGAQVLHECDNPPCVNHEHLFLGTNADNMADRDAKGRQVCARGDAHYLRIHPELASRGEDNGAAKLTEGSVIAIMQLRAEGWSLRKIAAKFGVRYTHVSDIVNRKFWKHVQVDPPCCSLDKVRAARAAAGR